MGVVPEEPGEMFNRNVRVGIVVKQEERSLLHVSDVLEDACVPQGGVRSHGATFSPSDTRWSLGQRHAADQTERTPVRYTAACTPSRQYQEMPYILANPDIEHHRILWVL
jgi:hypothetical protein